jgi:hypothetical protein
MLGFDYENQAWVVDGRYRSCGHSESSCGCYGKAHEGELAPPELVTYVRPSIWEERHILNQRNA